MKAIDQIVMRSGLALGMALADAGWTLAEEDEAPSPGLFWKDPKTGKVYALKDAAQILRQRKAAAP